MAELEIQDMDALFDVLGPQLVDSAPAFLGADVGQKIEMGEAFPIWLIPAHEIEWHSEISEIASPIGSVHIQLYKDGSPFAFARAHADPVASLRLTEIFSSDLAVRISLAAESIDKNRDFDDTVVRLLMVPGFQSEALWLHRGDADYIFPLRGAATSEEGGIFSWQRYRDALMNQGLVQGIELDHP